MATDFVSTWPAGNLLESTRQAIEGADDALLCVAFADTRGVHLLADQLRHARRARLVATSVFDTGRTAAALDFATQLGVECRVLNWSRGTFHPKLYLGRHARETTAVVGSANLTSGLFSNMEMAVVVTGGVEDGAIRSAWDTAEQLWDHDSSVDWQPGATRQRDQLEDDLLRRLLLAVHSGQTITTLSGGHPNRIADINAAGVWVQTNRSGDRAEHVEPRMIQVAWDWLVSHRSLENRTLLNDLRVHRSSFVSALLAQLNEVQVESIRPIRLSLQSDGSGAREPYVASLRSDCWPIAGAQS